jgi:hypothetical protein
MGEPIKFSRLGQRQIDALSNVAFGGKGTGVAPSMLKRLAAKGLIEPEIQTGSDRFGSYSWAVWSMPLSVHIQFCAFCAQSPDAEAALGTLPASGISA